MVFLGIDTSGKSGGVTLAEGDACSFRILASSPIAGGTFSAQLVPTIASLLKSHGFALNDIGGFAVASGPGSFTGLRVGLSAVKGLAEILKQPIATVSLLEALAISSGKHGRVAAALDAGRSEVFFGLYQISGVESPAAIASEKLLSHGEFLDSLNNANIDLLVTSDDAIAALARSAGATVKVEATSRPESSSIARIGLKKLLSGETVSVEALDANYIRRSDAEIFSKGPAMIRVRSATSQDLPRLLEIATHSVTAASWNVEEYQKILSSERPHGAVALVIHENESVEGFLFARRVAADQWEIENVAVRGSARRRGLGSHLLGEFLNLVRDRGGRDVFLEVRESNLAARTLYEKWAFAETGRRKDYYHDPIEDALVLKFSLPKST